MNIAMRSLRVMCFSAVVVAASLLTADEAICEQKKYDTLYLVGDSQCAGAAAHVRRSHDDRWTSYKHSCKVGSSTAYWSSNYHVFEPSKNDVVLVYLGSNDWGKPDPTRLLSWIRRSGARCVFVGPPKIRGVDNGVAENLKRSVETDGACKFFDTRKLNLRLPDGVHPDVIEHGRWFREVTRNL